MRMIESILAEPFKQERIDEQLDLALKDVKTRIHGHFRAFNIGHNVQIYIKANGEIQVKYSISEAGVEPFCRLYPKTTTQISADDLWPPFKDWVVKKDACRRGGAWMTEEDVVQRTGSVPAIKPDKMSFGVKLWKESSIFADSRSDSEQKTAVRDEQIETPVDDSKPTLTAKPMNKDTQIAWLKMQLKNNELKAKIFALENGLNLEVPND